MIDIDILGHEEKERIIASIKSKEISRSCDVCKTGVLYLSPYKITKFYDGEFLGYPNIKTVNTVCDRCGYIREHRIDLLNNEKEEE